VSYFDGRTQQARSDDILSEHGTAYAFTDTHPSHGVSNRLSAPEAWLFHILQRFRRMVIHLLSMTFIINLTALLVPLFVMMGYDKVIGARSSDTLPHLLWG
jgi:ATP-binding cassette subfamily C protein LapB